jgi:hypothetical protein
VVPGEVEKAIERGLREGLATEEFKASLDAAGVLSNAGEGVAEALATAALERGHRWRDGTNRSVTEYQTIVVDDGVCRLLPDG